MEYGKIWNPDICLTFNSRSGNLEIKGEYLSNPIPPTSSSKYIQNSRKNDPDYDNIETILARLEDDNNYKHELLINSSCDCAITNQLRLQKDVLVAAGINHDEYDEVSDEEDEVELTGVLKMLNRIRNNPLKKSSNKAFITLLDTMNYRSKVSEEQITEIYQYFDRETTEVQDLAMCVIGRLCLGKDNVHLFLERDVLSILHSKLSPMRPPQPLSAVVKVLDMIVSHEDLKVRWLGPLQDTFVPLLLRHLQVEEQMDFKLFVCCLFRRLAKFQEFAHGVLNDVVPIIDTIKSGSSRIKEVYTEVIMGAVQHTEQIPPNLIEMEVLPTAASLIKEGPCGPQRQALSLLVILTQTEAGVTTTVADPQAVPLVFCCIKQSKCKKVRAEAINVLHRVTSTRRLGLSKDLMGHMADHLTASHVSSPAGYNVVEMPPAPQIKTKYEREGLLWKGLDQLSVLMKDIMCREAKIQMDSSSVVKNIDFSPSKDTCPTCVGTLRHSITILLNICIWPASKTRHDVSRIDLGNFTDSPPQRVKLSKINRVLTQTVWDNSGTAVAAILSQFSKKLKRVLHMAEMIRGKKSDKFSTKMSFQSDACQRFQAALNQNGTIDLFKVFTEQEVQLIETILEFLLCVSLCTCKGFMDMVPKRDNSSPTISVSQKGRHTKSDSAIGKTAATKKPPRPASASHYRSTSPTKSRGASFHGPENPPNTARQITTEEKITPTQDPVEKHHMELLSREAATDRRLLRKCLYEAGVFFCVAPFINCSQQHCQTLACQISRCNIQPLEEKVLLPIRTKAPRMRPQSAVQGREAEKKLNIALHRMSPELAGIIKDALGPRPPSTPLTTPKGLTRPQSAHPIMDTRVQIQQPIHINMETKEEIEDPQTAARLSQFIEHKKQQTEQEKSLEFDLNKLRPLIDSSLPIAGQCRQELLEGCGSRLLAVLFSSPKETRKYFLQLLQDLVHYGEVEVHMKLSEFGCIQKLLDFLRVNTDNEMLEILGLIIVQMLCKSDDRLKQVFDRHGGMRLLMTLTRNTEGLLRQEVTNTLKTITRDVPKKKVRPKSAPVAREEQTPDVWDKIMDRWKTEDQVCKVLRQWNKK